MPLCERSPLTLRFQVYEFIQHHPGGRDGAQVLLDTAVCDLISRLEDGMLGSTCHCYDGVPDDDDSVMCACEWPNALTQEFTLGAVLADLYDTLGLTLPPELAAVAGLAEAPEPEPAA